MGDEGHGCHEGHEGNEEEGREQEGFPPGQEEQLHQGLDYCCPEGQEGFGPEGLRHNQEGLSSLQEGQGTLPVNIREHAEAAAQGVGMSTPLERSCFGWYVC